LLGLFKKRRGGGDFSRANVGFTQVVVGVKVPRFELDRLLELLGGQFKFSQVREIGGPGWFWPGPSPASGGQPS